MTTAPEIGECGAEKVSSKSSGSSLESRRLHTFDRVRVKTCKRRMENKVLANKKQKDLDVILGRANQLITSLKQGVDDGETNNISSISEKRITSLEKESLDVSDDDFESAAKRPMFKQTSAPVSNKQDAENTDQKNQTPVAEGYIRSSLSIDDYFKAKMKERKRKLGK